MHSSLLRRVRSRVSCGPPALESSFHGFVCGLPRRSAVARRGHLDAWPIESRENRAERPGHATELLPTQRPFRSASVRSCPAQSLSPAERQLRGAQGFQFWRNTVMDRRVSSSLPVQQFSRPPDSLHPWLAAQWRSARAARRVRVSQPAIDSSQGRSASPVHCEPYMPLMCAALLVPENLGRPSLPPTGYETLQPTEPAYSPAHVAAAHPDPRLHWFLARQSDQARWSERRKAPNASSSISCLHSPGAPSP